MCIRDRPNLAHVNTALEAYSLVGSSMAEWVASESLRNCKVILKNDRIKVDCVVINRTGQILART